MDFFYLCVILLGDRLIFGGGRIQVRILPWLLVLGEKISTDLAGAGELFFYGK